MVELNAVEARVLGALMEKEMTTPEYYPLSLNALVNACNQKSSRDPVMELSEEDVRGALFALDELALTRTLADGRVSKFEHRTRDRLNLRRDEFALLSLLLLRGPQTPAELRARAERLYSFDDNAAVLSTLERLATRDEPLTRALSRQPGAREIRWTQLLDSLDSLNPLDSPNSRNSQSRELGAPAAPASPELEPHSSGAVQRIEELGEAVRALEMRVHELEERVRALQRLSSAAAAPPGSRQAPLTLPGYPLDLVTPEPSILAKSEDFMTTLPSLKLSPNPSLKLSLKPSLKKSLKRSTLKTTLVCAVASLLIVAGCKKTAANTHTYKSAIDAFYSANPSCLWPQPQKFPQQIAASNTDQNAPFAALVDQGLLTRTTSEKKIVIISKQEINYDLSDQGRAAWTADPNQPGYGNFCYGHRSVQSIISASPNSGQPGATAEVTYTYNFSGAPGWAQAAETQNAFPGVRSNLSGGTAIAELAATSSGWQLQQPPASQSPQSTTPADGRIVQ